MNTRYPCKPMPHRSCANGTAHSLAHHDSRFSPLTPALSPQRGEGAVVRAAGGVRTVSWPRLSSKRAWVRRKPFLYPMALDVSPSPLNGERAGVRGETIQKYSTMAMDTCAGISGVTWGLIAILLSPLHIWSADSVSFSQPVETVEAYDHVEVIVRVDKPEARNPFLDATVTGSFS